METTLKFLLENAVRKCTLGRIEHGGYYLGRPVCDACNEYAEAHGGAERPTTYTTCMNLIVTAVDLDSLRDALQDIEDNADEIVRADIDYSALPTFGGKDISEWDDFAITSSYGPDHDDYGLYVSADRDGQYVSKNFLLPRGEAKRLGFVDSTWVGVTPETYQEFLKWLEDLPTYDDSYPEWVAKIKASKARQFNAGDAYFLGTQAAMDRHGEAPVIDTMINALKDSPRD